MKKIDIKTGHLDNEYILKLLEEHLQDMHSTSPPQSVHALDISGLQTPDVTFWSAWEGEKLLGCVALKELEHDHAEIKSMRTVTHLRNKGTAALLMTHLLAVAKERGYARLSLETGSMDFFMPARQLYAKFGFATCAPFADYELDPNSVFMTLKLR